MGAGAALVYVTLGRARIDYRFVLLGAVLPDALDGALVAAGVEMPGGRGPAHSLGAALLVAVAILAGFRGERRLAHFGVFVGWLTHLVADGMWAAPRTFLWPAFGFSFEAAPAEPYSWSLFTSPGSHLWAWAGEAAGFLLLWWFFVAFELHDAARRERFLRDGRLRA